MKRFLHHRIAVRTLVLRLLGLGVALACTGCQTTVEEYTPPAPVDPHRTQADRDSMLDDDAARAEQIASQAREGA